MAIGQKLEEARNRKGISIREASESTKIRGDFLTSFEAGKFDLQLPEVYLRGFIRVYARFLGIDPESAVDDLNLEIGGDKGRSIKKPIGKIGGSETSDSSKDFSSVDHQGMTRAKASLSSSKNPFIYIGLISGGFVLFAIILIVIFSSDDQEMDSGSLESNDLSKSSVRETVPTPSNPQRSIDSTNTSDLISGDLILKLATFGPIERLIISDEGKSPKVFHEFKNLSKGWEKSIPFSKSFRCYSSSLEHVRFAVDDGLEKQVNGQGAGNFSWSAEKK
jgi:cytoskeletal protein RodZ